MRLRTSRAAFLLTLLALSAGAISGCGSEKEAGTEDMAVNRARQVAAAWDGSPAADAWRAGYYPMEEAVQLPRGGLRSQADKRAYQAQNFVLRGKLPTTRPKGGLVAWASGKTLSRPLMGAQTAYMTLARARVDGIPHLTVTGAKLGEMSLATSRGPATVPAWFFTLQGYTAPLKRAAASPSKLPRPPIQPARDFPAGQLAPLDRLVQIDGDRRSVTVNAIHGACDDGPAVDVLETRGSVVLSASVKNPKTGDCTTQAKGKHVTVKLDRPVHDRVLLDAYTGRPVPYGQPNEPSPSWS
ncbi:hypothetical protein OG883_16530 [Streptomyces sp. NBC_01142]|uniref:hypothetical protein n=1 Tax=Streptomyces sp. NBC_01142 TaxID=2975865 RepID=UPI0022523CB2|nr:hypothetical protein [Streptomyces sp. NBC_01142]MCX4821474.1 hypothetical protein [Streptomyces sp. NBC_01142]